VAVIRDKTTVDGLSDVDLAALLCSRLCHDLISPVGAIVNGLELLSDDEDQETRALALDLVRRSAAQASAKLQFCRMAFGASGAAGSDLDLGEAGDLARLYFEGDKARLEWVVPRIRRPKAEVKLLLNLLLLGLSGVPRGGNLKVAMEGDHFVVRASGPGAKLPEPAQRLLAGVLDWPDLDARSIQAYYTVRLAADAAFVVRSGREGEQVVLTASPNKG
jgi:histidine phosphotransferase ChpT